VQCVVPELVVVHLKMDEAEVRYDSRLHPPTRRYRGELLVGCLNIPGELHFFPRNVLGAVHSAFERADVLPCQVRMAIYILMFAM
jgi:hypothetical protein